MAMSKVDYEFLADLFKGRCGQSYIDNGTMACLVADFVKRESAKNPRFNAEKFIKASTTKEVDDLIDRVPTIVDYGPPIVSGMTYYPNESVWRSKV